ncbi:PID1 isoform 4 [Pan troglodytes]|uniref:Phosphotyrosine interaction domain containing 1 n=2 Tax=Homininae TaxID=207598 RepID=F5H314_HUMAN|nr:PID1 isoform 4 [Pan troglodytes]
MWQPATERLQDGCCNSSHNTLVPQYPWGIDSGPLVNTKIYR